MAAPARTSASDLALPQTVVAHNGTQGLVASGQGPFSTAHQSYSGYQSGVAASFDFQPIMNLYYQGSVFSDAGSAQAYMTEGLNYAQSGSSSSPTDCTGTYNLPCQISGYATTSGDLVIYSVAQVNYCVIEVAYQSTSDEITANEDTVTKAAAATFTLGIDLAQQTCTGSSPASQPAPQAPQPTPTPQAQSATVSITGVGLAHMVHGKAKITKTLKSDEAGTFVALFQEQGTTASNPSATMVIFKGHKRMSGSISMREFTPTTGSPFFATQRTFGTTSHPLHLMARMTVSLDGSSDTQSLYFTVKPKAH